MVIETVDDLVEQIANWIGVYGCCKSAASGDDECKFDTNPLCCRVGFTMELKERMIRAVDNDNKLAQAGLKAKET